MDGLEAILQKPLEEMLGRQIGPHEASFASSTAIIFSSKLYEGICSRLEPKTLYVDEGESRIRFSRYITEDGRIFAEPYARTMHASIEMHNRMEILKFLYDHGSSYAIAGSAHAQKIVEDERRRNAQGFRHTLYGAVAMTLGGLLDYHLLDESLLVAGSIILAMNIKKAIRFTRHR